MSQYKPIGHGAWIAELRMKEQVNVDDLLWVVSKLSNTSETRVMQGHDVLGRDVCYSTNLQGEDVDRMERILRDCTGRNR